MLEFHSNFQVLTSEWPKRLPYTRPSVMSLRERLRTHKIFTEIQYYRSVLPSLPSVLH